MRRSSLIIGLLMLSVCAATGQAAALSIDPGEEAKAAYGEVAKCFAAMDAEPALAVVNAKFARARPSAAQLADASFATDAQSDALRLRVAKTRPCRELRLDALARFDPLLVPAYRILYYQADQVFDYLINQRISYGVANTLARDAMNAFALRDHAYMAAAGEEERRALSTAWVEELQRAHSNPPQTRAQSCKWVDVNVECVWKSP